MEVMKDSVDVSTFSLVSTIWAFKFSSWVSAGIQLYYTIFQASFSYWTIGLHSIQGVLLKPYFKLCSEVL